MTQNKPTFRRLYDLAGLGAFKDFAQEAGIGEHSVSNLYNGRGARHDIVRKALRVINDRLGTSYTTDDIEI